MPRSGSPTEPAVKKTGEDDQEQADWAGSQAGKQAGPVQEEQRQRGGFLGEGIGGRRALKRWPGEMCRTLRNPQGSLFNGNNA